MTLLTERAIAHRTIDSPIGSLLLAATDAGLARVAFEREGHDRVLDELASIACARRGSTATLDAAAAQLDEYFAGRRRTFDVPFDLERVHGFRRAVLRQLTEIPYGSTVTYAAVATAIDSPKAVRAVGTACAMNPLPIVIPCHRVVRADGSAGEYLGGIEAKQWLLEREGVCSG